MSRLNDATVNDVIEMLTELKKSGYGDYVVICNSEYVLAKKGDKADIREDKRTVDLGGYM